MVVAVADFFWFRSLFRYSCVCFEMQYIMLISVWKYFISFGMYKEIQNPYTTQSELQSFGEKSMQKCTPESTRWATIRGKKKWSYSNKVVIINIFPLAILWLLRIFVVKKKIKTVVVKCYIEMAENWDWNVIWNDDLLKFKYFYIVGK